MKTFALLFALVASIAFAGDVVLKNAGVTKGPVISLNCQADAGLSCDRDAGAMGNLRCNVASPTEPGCIAPNVAQSFSGQKTFGAGYQASCVAHASLTACSAGNAGLEQCCSTHANAHVYCNGTSNLELTGSSNATTIATFTQEGLFSAGTGLVLGGMKLPYAYTVTGISGFVQQGTGAGQVINWRFSDGTNFCDCPLPCDNDSTGVSCTGNCSYAANTLVIVSPSADGCTTPPTIRSPVVIGGYLQ